MSELDDDDEIVVTRSSSEPQRPQEDDDDEIVVPSEPLGDDADQVVAPSELPGDDAGEIVVTSEEQDDDADQVVAPSEPRDDDDYEIVVTSEPLDDEYDEIVAPSEPHDDDADQVVAPSEPLDDDADEIVAPSEPLDDEDDEVVVPSEPVDDEDDEVVAPSEPVDDEDDEIVRTSETNIASSSDSEAAGRPAIARRKKGRKSAPSKMIDLASKTQKLVRDSRVSLPYHRPKQLTLDEFLKRRNIVKAKVLTDLVNTDAISSLRGTIDVKRDVLPIMIEAERVAELEKKSLEQQVRPLKCQVMLEKCTDQSSINEWLEKSTPEDKMDLGEEDGLHLLNTAPALVEESLSSQGNQVKDVPYADDKVDFMEAGGFEMSPSKSIVTKEPDPERDHDAIKFTNEKGQAAADPHGQHENEIELIREKEAELTAFLNERNPKPKKKTIAEMLKEMPGYAELVKIKPRISGGETKKGMIDLDDFKKPEKSSKTEEKIQILMAKLAKHTFSSVVKSQKSEVHKLHINKTEKDSQGLLHSVVDEIDYVEPPPSESQDDFLAQINRPAGTSPREPIPGEKFVRLRNFLQEQIRGKRNKQWEEKTKLQAMYDKEKELEDKENGDYPEDEELFDDEEIEISDSEDEEEEEEDDNDVIDRKKKRTRIKYIDDEAEDEDNDNDDSSEDDESDKDPGENADSSKESDEESQDIYEEIKRTRNEKDCDSSQSSELKTPQTSACTILNQQTGDKDLCNPFAKPKRMDEISPLIPKIRSKEHRTISGDNVSGPIAALVTGNEGSSEDIMDLCSGNFPSQAPSTPYETQNCFGFDDDESDDELFVQTCDVGLKDNETCEPSTDLPAGSSQTPGNSSVTAGNTPKLTDKVVKSRSLGQRFEIEARKMNQTDDNPPTRNNVSVSDEHASTSSTLVKTKLNFDDLVDETSTSPASQQELVKEKGIDSADDDDEDDVGIKLVKRGKRQLEFSDDENDDVEDGDSDGTKLSQVSDDEEINDENDHHLDEDAEEYSENEEDELERQLAVQESKPKTKSLFGKNGRLKKKFYDEEAELSGSEEGSGDEDERGINFYEDEEGDKDQLDEEAVKNEVERAHLKHLLDTDDRQIRQLREEYLERGDLEDGKLRERKFRWFDVEGNFNDDDARAGDSDGELGGDDDEEEIKRKLQEIERRKWIHEHSQLFETPEEESQKLFENSKFLKLGKSTMKKIGSLVDNTSFSMNDSSNSVPDPSFASLFKSKIKSSTQAILSAGGPTEEASEFDEHLKLNKAMSQPLFASPDNPLIKIKKGSFLNRGSPALSRMAEFTKVNESSTTVKSNSRNFVFSVVTPPDQASNKLKVPKRQAPSQGASKPTKMPRMDRSFNNLDDKSKSLSIFKWM